jgi:hypothetical protein
MSMNIGSLVSAILVAQILCLGLACLDLRPMR